MTWAFDPTFAPTTNSAIGKPVKVDDILMVIMMFFCVGPPVALNATKTLTTAVAEEEGFGPVWAGIE